MFGKIIRIEENTLVVENLSHEVSSEYMNFHVIFEEKERKIVGEIVKYNKDEVEILLVGELKGNSFFPGVIKKPTIVPRIISLNELSLIIGTQENNKDYLSIGSSYVYNGVKVSAKVNDLFASHLAIIGNTGSGKSCASARILQNLFNENNKPVNAHFIIFDAYGEYKNAFNYMNECGLGFKKINTVIETSDEVELKIPVNFLEADDLAVLLSLNSSSQLPILEKALKLVYIFTSKEEKVKEYKNDIIAKCLLDILTSGKSAAEMRDQIIGVLSHFNTDDINLNSIISQPGYDRTLKQCLLIDEQGKMNAILLVNEFLSRFTKVSIDDIVVDKTNVYSLKDLYYALEFALISEGVLNSNLTYEKNNIIKNRLQTIINSEYKSIFEVDNYITKEEYINNFFRSNDGVKTQIIDLNLSHLDDRFAKIITKLLSKLMFTYTTKLEQRGTFPINIVLEEAHRYVQNDSDIDVIGYNIFDRITKEGRKYGTLLTFITQRPSELSQTVLSQCSNFLVFRIFHPKDFDMVKDISTNLTTEYLEKLKILNTGSALVFGTGFKLPVIVKLDLPNPMPESTSLKINNIWY